VVASYQRSYCTSGPVTTGMGDRFRTDISPRYSQPATQANSASEKCGDALQLSSKGGYSSFHLWINVCAQVKLCDHVLY